MLFCGCTTQGNTAGRRLQKKFTFLNLKPILATIYPGIDETSTELDRQIVSSTLLYDKDISGQIFTTLCELIGVIDAKPTMIRNPCHSSSQDYTSIPLIQR